MDKKAFLLYSNNYFKNKKRLKLQIFLVYLILFILLFCSIAISASFLESTKRIFSTKDNKFIAIVPKEMELGMIKIDSPSFLGKSSLTQEDVTKISKITNVSQVSAIYTLKAPSNIYGRFFEMSYGTDLNVFGNENVFEKYKVDTNNIKVIPGIISSKLLDIYNLSFAPANGLPKLTEKVFVGRKFNLRIGSNSFNYKKENITVKLKIVGLSDQVDIFGVTIPKIIMNKIEKRVNAASLISSIKVYADNASDLLEVVSKIEKLGYKIKTSDNKLFEGIHKYINNFEYLINIPIIMVLIIIFVFINNQLNYLLNSQKKEMGIQLAYGMDSSDLISSWIFQYFKIISLAIITGMLSGSLAMISLFKFFLKDLEQLILLDFGFFKQGLFSLGILLFSLFFIHILLRKYLSKNTIVSLIKEN